MGLLQRSISAGILIAGIFVFRRLASGKLSKRVFAALWKIALLRLLLPFSFQVESRLLRRLPFVFLRKEANQAMMEGRGGGLGTAQGAEFLEITVSLFRNMDFIYFLGVTILVFFFALEYARACILLREAIPVSAFGDIGTDVGKCSVPLTGKVKILVMDRVKTPVTYGVFRPQIILPKSIDWKDKDMLSFVLQHEMAHIRHMDNLWKLLLIAALCLHWFNPLVFVLYFSLNRDMEIACDESVISAMNENDRHKYAIVLVNLAENCASFPIYSGFGKSAVSERIREIMNYKKMTKVGSICAAFVLLGSAAVFVSAKESVAQSAPCASATVAEECVGGHENEGCATVYFEESISEERIEEIGNELLAIDGVTGIGFTSADAAWSMFADEYLSEDIVLSFQGENPLKDSANYTVYFSEKGEEMIRSIEGIEGVRRVVCE